MSAEEAIGLPAEQQLALRDDEGRSVDVDLISIEPEAVSPDPGVFHDLCRAHGFVDTAWVLAAFTYAASTYRDV